MPGTPQYLRRSSVFAAAFLLAAAAGARPRDGLPAGILPRKGRLQRAGEPDGRPLPAGRAGRVAEKSGLIKSFDSLTDTTATVVADLRTRTHNFWDRGLLGLAVPPGYDPASADEWRRYVYVLYARDALPGGEPPRWGVVDGTSDPCPAPNDGPGPTRDGCVVTGQLSRLLTTDTPWSEHMLPEGWCHQFPSHAPGALDFGADEKLYVSGGDGASFGNADWGQLGGTVQIPGQPGAFYTPKNPCADPPLPPAPRIPSPPPRAARCAARARGGQPASLGC